MNRTIKLIAGLALVLGFVVAGATVARARGADRTDSGHYKNGDGQKHAGMRFEKADKNGDGFLTADEVGAKRWEHISVADANKDSKVSKAELEQARKDGKLGRKGKRHEKS